MLGQVVAHCRKSVWRRFKSGHEEDHALSRDQIWSQDIVLLFDDLCKATDEVVFDDVHLISLGHDVRRDLEQLVKLRRVKIDVPIQVGEVRKDIERSEKEFNLSWYFRVV